MSIPRYATPITSSRRNIAGEAVKLAKLLDVELMPWQQDAVALFTELDATGKYIYRDASLLVGRQSGKSLLALILLLLRCFATPDTKCVFGAQTLKDARAMLLETWEPLLAASPLKDTYSVRAANGSERILFHNGSSISLLTTTSTKAGHGLTVDFAILDEAFAQPDAHVEQAVLPAMATRSDHGGGPQYVVISNAGTLDGKSPYLWERVLRGRQLVTDGITEGSAFIEWSAPDDADPANPKVWAACNPALGYTISEDAIRSEFRSMELPEFQRARLCQWTLQKDEPVINLDRWADLEDSASSIIGSKVFAIDVAPARAHSSIAVAGKRADGKFHVETIYSDDGTAGLVQRLAELVKKHSPLGIMADGMVASLVPEIERSGIQVTLLAAHESAAAFALFLESVNNGVVFHRRDDALVHSITSAITRSLGDGGQAWSRKATSTHIDNLVAITNALWGAESHLAAPQVFNLHEVIANMIARKDRERGETPEESQRRRATAIPRRPGRNFTVIEGLCGGPVRTAQALPNFDFVTRTPSAGLFEEAPPIGIWTPPLMEAAQ